MRTSRLTATLLALPLLLTACSSDGPTPQALATPVVTPSPTEPAEPDPCPTPPDEAVPADGPSTPEPSGGPATGDAGPARSPAHVSTVVDPSDVPQDDPCPSPSPEPVVAGTAPLTGVPTDDEQLAHTWQTRPVVAVKVGNSAAARPQTGLEQADVVFEELTEGGVTRFIALFHSQLPDEVGNVRSGRLVDVDVLPAYQPLLVISGARPDVLSTMRKAGLEYLAEGASGLYRAGHRRAPHNVYADLPRLVDAHADRVPTATALPWTFDAAVPGGGQVGTSTTVRMSAVAQTSFTFDPDVGVYRRFQNGQAHTVTGEGRIGAANVLVLKMRIVPGACCDPAGNRLTRTEVVGSGDGTLLRDGRSWPVSWSKASRAGHLHVTFADGSPASFRPGPTWVLLAPR